MHPIRAARAPAAPPRTTLAPATPRDDGLSSPDARELQRHTGETAAALAAARMSVVRLGEVRVATCATDDDAACWHLAQYVREHPVEVAGGRNGLKNSELCRCLF
jgi:hypothetical protein